MNKIKEAFGNYIKGLSQLDSDVQLKLMAEVLLPVLCFALSIFFFINKASAMGLYAMIAFVLLSALFVFKSIMMEKGKYLLIIGTCKEIEPSKISTKFTIESEDNLYHINSSKKMKFKVGDNIKIVSPQSSIIQVSDKEHHINSLYLIKKITK